MSLATSALRRRLAGRGFTFIEILATMTLIAIVLPSVMSGISHSLGAADWARGQAQAAALAHSKLMELAVGGQWQTVGLSGDFGDDWPGYRWTAQTSQWDGNTLTQLDVTVWWPGRGGQERSLTMSTLVSTGAGGTT